MNIQEAKQEIINTVRVYMSKNKEGLYRIPLIHQRPILLMGVPGIGKTAIVEQAANECKVGLLSYTITHHTRQSAVGLPVVEKRMYDGQEASITEYTMSEIVASIYDYMENTGYKEGILFIDEINCVSETLAPTMLQLLQRKTFGNHKIPNGWIIVAAGNPPEYNKSVREFDIVTLDRVKKIEIDVEYEPWRRYAIEKSLHGAIRTYLDGKSQNFYYIEQNPEEKIFVTARGWEDLSAVLKEYEYLGIKVDENLIKQYIQWDEIARDFAAFYELYCAYEKQYGNELQKIISGEKGIENMDGCTLDEQLTITNLMISKLLNKVMETKEDSERIHRLVRESSLLSAYIDKQHTDDYTGMMIRYFDEKERIRTVKVQTELLSEKEAIIERNTYGRIRKKLLELKKAGIGTWKDAKKSMQMQELFQTETVQKQEKKCADSINDTLGWIKEMFGTGTAFITALECITNHSGCMELIQFYGCDAYTEHCQMLAIKNREQELLKKIKVLQTTPVF